MHKNITGSIFFLNKTIALLTIEPLYLTVDNQMSSFLAIIPLSTSLKMLIKVNLYGYSLNHYIHCYFQVKIFFAGKYIHTLFSLSHPFCPSPCSPESLSASTILCTLVNKEFVGFPIINPSDNISPHFPHESL